MVIAESAAARSISCLCVRNSFNGVLVVVVVVMVVVVMVMSSCVPALHCVRVCVCMCVCVQQCIAAVCLLVVGRQTCGCTQSIIIIIIIIIQLDTQSTLTWHVEQLQSAAAPISKLQCCIICQQLHTTPIVQAHLWCGGVEMGHGARWDVPCATTTELYHCSYQPQYQSHTSNRLAAAAW